MNYIEQAYKLRSIIEKAVQSLDDIDALEAVTLYPHWEADVIYNTGMRVEYDGFLYTVLTPHISQEDWTPDISPSLFARVLIPNDNIIPLWEQPDSTNPYMIGDKVEHNGKIWICDIDNNVWEPGIYGWIELEEA